MIISIPALLSETHWKTVKSKIQFKTGISAELRAFEKLSAAFKKTWDAYSVAHFNKMVGDIDNLVDPAKKKAKQQLQKTLTTLYKAMLDLDTAATKVAKLAAAECTKANGFLRKKLTNKESVDYLKQVQTAADKLSNDIQLAMGQMPFDWAEGPT